MNTQERDQLTTFLQQLGQARAAVKDSEAQMLIDTAVARQPDAAYLLVQRSLLQDNALQTAQAQIASLQAELQQAKSAASTAPAGGNFLDANGWGRVPVAPSYPAAPAPAAAYVAAPGYPQAAPAAATPSRFQAPSFLTSMATTAAGVAAGAFLFQGIEGLMGHHGSSGLAGASAFGLSEPKASSLLDSNASKEGSAPVSNDTALQSGNDNADAFGNDDGLDIGGDSSDWA